MNQTLNELSRILVQIEEYHGTIQDTGAHKRVRQLHAKARECIDKLSEQHSSILDTAQDTLSSGRTYTIVDRSAILQDGLQDIINICTGEAEE